jgi:hypothetical protein
MINLSDIESSDKYWTSLSKLTGLKIADLHGYFSDEWGEPLFVITGIMLENGIELGVDGEHEMAYITTYNSQMPPNMDSGTMGRLLREQQILDGDIDEEESEE